MELRNIAWSQLWSPRYLVWAIPGLCLLMASYVFWGRGWWVQLILFIGVCLLTWPLPRKAQVRRATPGAGRSGPVS